MIKFTPATLTCQKGDEKVLEEYKDGSAVESADIGTSLQVQVRRLATVERKIQKHKHTTDTLDKLYPRLDDAEVRMRVPRNILVFSKIKYLAKSNQLFSKNHTASGYRERVAILVKALVRLSAGEKKLTTRDRGDRNLLGGIRTELNLRKAAAKQSVSLILNRREKLSVDLAVADMVFNK